MIFELVMTFVVLILYAGLCLVVYFIGYLNGHDAADKRMEEDLRDGYVTLEGGSYQLLSWRGREQPMTPRARKLKRQESKIVDENS